MDHPGSREMTPFRITYVPGRAEFAAALAARPTSRLAGIAFVASIVLLAGIVGVLSEQSTAVAAALAWSPPFGQIAVIGLLVLAWSGVVLWLGRLVRDIRAVRLARSAQPVSLTMDDEGIAVAEGAVVAEREAGLVHPWAKVLAVTPNETHVVVAFVDRPLLAVPLAAFGSRAEAAVFSLAAEDHLARDRAREDAEAAGTAVGAAS